MPLPRALILLTRLSERPFDIEIREKIRKKNPQKKFVGVPWDHSTGILCLALDVPAEHQAVLRMAEAGSDQKNLKKEHPGKKNKKIIPRALPEGKSGYSFTLPRMERPSGRPPGSDVSSVK